MAPLEGLEESTCDDLQDHYNKFRNADESPGFVVSAEQYKALKPQLERHPADFETETNDDGEIVVQAEYSGNFEGTKVKVRRLASLGCGLEYIREEEPDGSGLDQLVDCGDIEETYETISEAQEEVQGTIPQYIVSDDLIYREIADEENQKRIFREETVRGMDRLEELGDELGCSVSPSESKPKKSEIAGPMQIECKMPTEEGRQECLEQYTDFDVKSSGLAGIGDPFPTGYTRQSQYSWQSH